MANKIFYQEDCNLSLLDGKKIAIIGYGSQVLSAATGMPFQLVTVLLAVIALSYSLFSGIKASMLTDAIQMVFMLAAKLSEER